MPKTKFARRKVTAIIAIAALTIAGAAFADQATEMAGKLPSVRWRTSAVATASSSFVFGGFDGSYIADIVRYDISSDTAVKLSSLPSGRWGTSAVYNGQSSFVFGGKGAGDSSFLNQIVKVEVSGATTTLGVGLPSGRAGTSAVWVPDDGNSSTTHDRKAYIFGGCESVLCPISTPPSSQIVAFDPSTNVVTIKSATLPGGRYGSSAVWTGTYAYIFDESGPVLRYDPASDAVATMRSNAARAGASAAWDGQYAYLFGGETVNLCVTCPALISGAYHSIVARYDPETDSFSDTAATLPSGRTDTSAVWINGNAYVFGGQEGAQGLNQIVRFRPSLGAPRNLSASPGPGPLQIVLSWTPPSNFPSDVAGYRVYRGLTPHTLAHLADLGNVGSYVDSDLGCPALCYYRVFALGSEGEGVASPVSGSLRRVV